MHDDQKSPEISWSSALLVAAIVCLATLVTSWPLVDGAQAHDRTMTSTHAATRSTTVDRWF